MLSFHVKELALPAVCRAYLWLHVLFKVCFESSAGQPLKCLANFAIAMTAGCLFLRCSSHEHALHPMVWFLCSPLTLCKAMTTMKVWSAEAIFQMFSLCSCLCRIPAMTCMAHTKWSLAQPLLKVAQQLHVPRMSKASSRRSSHWETRHQGVSKSTKA